MRTSINDLRELEDVIFDDGAVPTTAPIIAENELWQRRRGLHFWTVSDEDRRKLLSVVWSWDTACCYVAWQTFEGAAAGVASFRKWKGRIWRDPLRPDQQMTMAEAELALRNALQGGSLKAQAMLGDDVSEIPAGEWPRLNFERNAHGEVINFERLQRKGKPGYEEPTLRRIDVMKLRNSIDGWAPDFDEVVDINPADIKKVPNPVALIAGRPRAAEVEPPSSDPTDEYLREEIRTALEATFEPGKPRQTVLFALKEQILFRAAKGEDVDGRRPSSPSQVARAISFNASRSTFRKALEELRGNGLLDRFSQCQQMTGNNTK